MDHHSLVLYYRATQSPKSPSLCFEPLSRLVLTSSLNTKIKSKGYFGNEGWLTQGRKLRGRDFSAHANPLSTRRERFHVGGYFPVAVWKHAVARGDGWWDQTAPAQTKRSDEHAYMDQSFLMAHRLLCCASIMLRIPGIKSWLIW